MQSAPRIDRKLNLVIPVEGTTRGTIYIHSMPISREVMRQYYRVLAIAHAEMYKDGISVHSGPRIAAMLIEDAAERLGRKEEVAQGLFAEIRRLTNVAVLDAGGWKTVPYHEAREWLDEDDQSEVENAIAFFILNSSMMRRDLLPSILNLMSSLWGAQIVSSDCTAFAASLPKSTPDTSMTAAA